MKTSAFLALVLTLSVAAGCQKTKSQQPLSQVPPPPPTNEKADLYVPPTPLDDSASVRADAAPAPAPAPAYTAPAAAAPAPTYPVSRGQSYTVQHRDTLWSIAVRFYGDGKRWRDIAAANSITNERRLIIGQTLVIP